MPIARGGQPQKGRMNCAELTAGHLTLTRYEPTTI